MQQYNIPNPSVTVCLANHQRAKWFVEYNISRQKGKNGERRKRDTGQNGRRDGREETPSK